MRNSSMFLAFSFYFPQIHDKKARASSHPDPCLTVYLTSFYFLPQTKIDFSISLRVKSQRSSISLLIVQSIKLVRLDQRFSRKDVRERRKGFDNGQNPKQGQGQRQEKARHSFLSSWSSGTLFLAFLWFWVTGFSLLFNFKQWVIQFCTILEHVKPPLD